MVFYLLAECANESLGLKINGLKVTHKWKTEALSEGTMTWNASEGKGAAHIEQQNFTAGVSFLVRKKPDKPDKPENPETPSTTPGETPVPIPPKEKPKTDPKETPGNSPETPKNPPETG